MKKNKSFFIRLITGAGKKYSALILAVSLSLYGAPSLALETSAAGAVVTDCATGYVIYEKNADETFVPASMTKIMTLYVFFSEMDGRGLTLDSPVTVSENAARVAAEKGLSNVPLRQGESYTVDSLISAVCTASACGAAVALAEAISGGEAEFVALMNEYAAKMGLTAYFTDSYGISEYNYITPRSMAALSRKAVLDYPMILNYSSAAKIVWEGKIYWSTNQLLPGMPYAYAGTDGLKTGFTNQSGYCLTSTAVKDGRRIISAVFGTESRPQSFTESEKLLDFGFENCGERIREFYDISCGIDAPEQVYFDEDFTVCAELGGVVTPTVQKGEWLVNDIPIAGYQYDSLNIENGEKIYFHYNTGGYDGGSIKVTLRLYTPSDSVSFDRMIRVLTEYKPTAPEEAAENGQI